MKLREYRLKNNLTQTQVAEKLNIQKATYSHYETGINRPSIDTLTKLADYYHTTIDSLVGHEVPYLFDKGLLTNEQANLVDKVKDLTKEQCMLVQGYIEGIKNKK